MEKREAIGNIRSTMYYYPRNGQMGDTDPTSKQSC